MKTAIIIAIVAILGILGYFLLPCNKWDKTFAHDPNVTVQKVHFKNRYGIELTGDLYMPKNKPSGKMSAIALSGPFGAVKEQVSGRYAQEMAKRGFVTVAFDPSYTGESGGKPRSVASPEINTEDFSAAVDYLTTLPYVDENKIGIIGICGFGGFGLNAAAMDTRIHGTVTITMYDIPRVYSHGYNDSMSADELYAQRVELNNQRTVDAKTGKIAKSASLPNPEDITEDTPQFLKDYVAFYKTPLGYHKRSIGSNLGWNKTSDLSLMTMPILAFSDTIKSPVLMIHGEKAHSRYFSEDAYKKLKGDNKELMIIPGANHTDLYYKMDVIPFDKIESFMRESMK